MRISDWSSDVCSSDLVVSTVRVKDYEAALALANQGNFGLSAGIVTTSLKHARHFRRNVRAGMVMVNLPTAGVDYHVPFGGTRGSSYGPREQGFAAVEYYTQMKKIGRAHVCTPVTNAHSVCRLLLEKQTTSNPRDTT